MKKQDMIEYLREELLLEESKMQAGLDNNYSYIFMICNDLGIVK